MVKNHPQMGVFIIEGEPQFLTLELPWLNNQHGISCIPEGVYVCKKTLNRHLSSGKSIPVTFEVTNVPHRVGILFHVGNEIIDTHGCILIGERIVGPDFLGDSKEGFANFLETLQGVDEFQLTIKRCFEET